MWYAVGRKITAKQEDLCPWKCKTYGCALTLADAADLWGQGIAAAAVGELCRTAFADLGVERLWAAVFEGNRASCRVLEKCGFTREATLRRAARKNGKTLDVVLYGRWKADGE